MTTTSKARPAIEACGLVKAFRTVRAVDGLDLLVPSGGVLGGTPAASEVGRVLLASAILIAVFGPLTMRLYRFGPRG
jgi:hypothetical protein